MLALKSLLVFGLPCTFAFFLSGRDSATINKDLATLDSAVRNGTRAAGFVNDAGATQGAYLCINVSIVDSSTRQATRDTQATATLTIAECSNTITYLNQTLEPDTKALNNAIGAKNSTLARNGVRGCVCNYLKASKTDTASFNTSLIQICPAAQKASLSAVLAKIDADYNAGVTVVC